MKRFTETTKWTVNPWFRKLPPRLKCLWQFLVDSCDAAGVIDPDWELVSFQIGEDVNPEDLKSFGERIEILPNGKLFIGGFIAFQYGELSPTCKPHTPVFKSLLSNGIERHSKPFPYPLDTLEEEDKDKEGEKELILDGGGDRKQSARKPENTPLMIRLGKFFNRRETTRLSEKELKALKSLMPLDAEDVDLMERYYLARIPSDHIPARRTDLLTVLNNWNGELDRATVYFTSKS